MTTTESTREYDAIVVGARCAGAPTAMLLARAGHRVLLVDRAGFPSDTVSTHLIHAPGVAALRRWGLLDAVVASGCPAIETYALDFGPITIKGTPRPVEGSSLAYAPRRTVLDKVLVDGAVAAGVELREHFSVEEIVIENDVVAGIRGHGADGVSVTERAQVVIGADGRNSRVAKAVKPEQYNDKPMLQWSFYSYFSGLPMDGFETYIRPDRGWAAFPTNDDLTLVVAGWPQAESTSYKADVEANFMKTFELAPAFAERIHGAKREAKFAGGSVPNFFRKPFGPGWALVGDAGHTKDPITAQGIGDAFSDAELCAAALHDSFTGARPFDGAMAHYQQSRDLTMPMYEFTTQLATLEPPPAEIQQLLGAIHGNQEAMDGFVGVISGVVSPMEFFDPDNIGRLLSGVSA